MVDIPEYALKEGEMILVQKSRTEERRPAEARALAEYRFLPRLLSYFIIFTLFWAVSSPALAQDVEYSSENISISSLPAPEPSQIPLPIQKQPPNYPAKALREWKEGWVVLSYTIATTGSVIEPMIEDSSGNEDMEKAALKAVKGWKFSPAIENNVPVEQSLTKVRLVFQLDKSIKSARQEFVAKYKRIMKLIEERKFNEADPLLTELQYGEKQNLYEDAFFWWLQYVYLETQGSSDNIEKRNRLNRAIGYQEEYLPPDIFVAATKDLFKLEVKDLLFGNAITTYEWLLNSKGAKRSKYYKDTISTMEALVLKLREIINGNSILKLNARVGEHDYWIHSLVRRSFSIDGINGIVKLVDIRCTNHTERYHLSETNTWELPDEWGECALYVKGEPGTTFNFYEFHPTVAVSN